MQHPVQRQGWQTSLSSWNSTGCGSKRLDNDVSADADYLTGFDVYDSYNCGDACSPAPGWFTVGGTSLSSPIIAAAYALAGGAHGVSYPALTLYGHRNQAYDVTTGGNGWCDGEGAAQCPNPNSLRGRRAGLRLHRRRGRRRGRPRLRRPRRVRRPDRRRHPQRERHVRQDRAVGRHRRPRHHRRGDSATFTAKVIDPFPGGFADHYVWNWGDGTSSTTTTNSASHTYKTTGTHTITLTVTDNYLGTGTATHAVKVAK